MKHIWDLFVTFLKVGTFGFGGGQASIPLIEEEVVFRHNWLSEETFVNYVAIGNTLPGPIATKMGVLIGYDQAGYLGAFASLLGILLPSTVLALVLINILLKYQDSATLKGMQDAVKPVVAVLVIGVGIAMLRSPLQEALMFETTKNWLIFGLFIVSAVLVALNIYADWFHVHPAFIVIGTMLFGALFLR